MTFACPECGHRQDADAPCAKCRYDGVLDTRKPQTLELLHDIEQGLRDRRETRLRFASVGVAMAIVLTLWTQPAYWHMRGKYYPGLPFFAEQFAFMIVIGLGMMKLVGLLRGNKRRFPYVSDDGQLLS